MYGNFTAGGVSRIVWFLAVHGNHIFTYFVNTSGYHMSNK